MYETKSQTFKEFVEDDNIKLPRFQRKLTWNNKKNFYLTLSVFKGYPLGVTILRFEQDKQKNITKWLLDGRQRRHALKLMLNDPEQIYKWACSALGIKKNDNKVQVQDKFWDKVNEYIEFEPDSDEEKEFNQEIEKNSDNNEIDFDEENNVNYQNTIDNQNEVYLLLELILISHLGGKGKNTGITQPFDFSDFVDKKISYIDNKKINCSKLKDFIDSYKKDCSYENVDYKNKEEFKRFFKKVNVFDEKKSSKFNSTVDSNWDKDILRIIILFDKLNQIFQLSSIGLIEIRDINSTDAQKIFNLINTGGTKLTAAEILSAKPTWNTSIKNPTNELVEKAKQLYKNIKINQPEYIVKWDVAATFIDRLKNFELFFNEKDYSDENGLAKKITISFKLLSAIHNKGIKKEDVDKLTGLNIDWTTDIDELVSDLNILIRIITETEYFSYLSSWNSSISSLIGDAPTIYFIALLYFDWKSRNKPINNKESNKIKKNALILFDRLLYEYLNKTWRGSSDSKVGKNLLNYKENIDLFSSIDEKNWLDLIKNLFYDFKIGNDDSTQSDGRILLHHYYCLNSISGPDRKSYEVEVDHIYPQALIEESNIHEKKKIKDACFNLGLLPKNKNASKGRKKLIEIKLDKFLADAVTKYEDIEKNDFEKFSDLNNWKLLRDLRFQKFTSVFSSERNNKLNN